MRMPRVSLTVAMLWIMLVAVNLGAYKFLSSQIGTEFAKSSINTAWVMINFLSVLGYRRATTPGGLGPFSVGFLYGGLIGLLAQVGWMLAFPSAQSYAFRWTGEHLADYSSRHLPGAKGLMINGEVYLPYLPARIFVLALIFSFPQLVLALIGGVVSKLITRRKQAVVGWVETQQTP
ncbi:hypothetical protein TA3x_003925 [Tundrisphaera sp. TA3]|uniref:hypothetical protein n=1 Tax=Tundrisphaera sp. TA3 TaxID=3435775 RepID=UPI003EBEEC14